jgi:hypothetical protein
MQQADNPDAAPGDHNSTHGKALAESGSETHPSAPQMGTVAAALRSQQSLVGALAGGLFSALIGAVIWAAITVVTEYQIGWMSVGIGFLVGMAVRKYGRGITELYGALGAALSLLGCLLGNLLSLGGFIAQKEGVGLLATELSILLHPGLWVPLFQATFNPMDVLFYGIAVYEGYRFSFRQITRADVAGLVPATSEGAADG